MLLHDVQLEIVRPGPPHNQPLNELTQYMALCGENSPITFNVPFEHAELLSRLSHLRYYVESSNGEMIRVGGSIRENTMSRLGIEMGALLNEIRSLGTELASVRPENWRSAREEEFVHLRLVLSGSELAILPFELSIAPNAMAGEGQELFLQSRLQIVPTREIRRSRPLTTRLSDFEQPSVLFAYAAPGSSVPAVEHLHAIRCALDPWVGQSDSDRDSDTSEEPHQRLKSWIRVLPNATLRSISELCAQQRFSHVHILAHGDTYREAGQERWGIALCSDNDPRTKHVVSGKRLGHALAVQSSDRNSRSAPFWVTLASCDSGNAGSVMVPGGSIAHELHTSGIPWVLASQFPLTKGGSVEMTRLLYERLLGGDDPRQALYETRKRLFTHADQDHDWASLVTYASIPPKFDVDVSAFFEKMTENAIERVMSGIDDLFKQHAEKAGQVDRSAIDTEFGRVQELLGRWEERIPEGETSAARRGRTLFYGITGSVNKRLAQHTVFNATDPATLLRARELLLDANVAYRTATDAQAFDDNLFNWVASQFLSTSAALGLLITNDPSTSFRSSGADILAILVANSEHLLTSTDAKQRAWAAASRAEAELIQFIERTRDEPGSQSFRDVLDVIEPLVDTIKETMGRDSFQVDSTQRQFERYASNYSGLADFSDAVTKVAETVVERFEQ